MAVTYHLPVDFFDQANLLDANFAFALQDKNVPTSKIFTEKYAAKKGDYNFMAIGTASSNHPQAVLYEESNFTDIGGGLMTFHRKFAQIPEDHEELVTISIRAGRILGVNTASYLANFIGGNVVDGLQELLVNGTRDSVRVKQSNTYDIPVIKKTSYFLKSNDSATDVFMDNASEIMIVRDEVSSNFSVTKFSFGSGNTITLTRYSRGSKFDRNTVVRKENDGRYLGNIFKVCEYRLLNDTITNRGAILSDTQIDTPNI